MSALRRRAGRFSTFHKQGDEEDEGVAGGASARYPSEPLLGDLDRVHCTSVVAPEQKSIIIFSLSLSSISPFFPFCQSICKSDDEYEEKRTPCTAFGNPLSE